MVINVSQLYRSLPSTIDPAFGRGLVTIEIFILTMAMSCLAAGFSTYDLLL